MAEFITLNASAAQRLAVKSSGPQVASTTRAVARYARLYAPGSMKSQIRPISTGGPSPIGIVICDHPASVFVLRGTKPHIIKPKKPKGRLVFTPRGSGTKVFARLVHHPGTKANNFLLKALRSV